MTDPRVAATVENWVADLIDDERTSCTFAEADQVAADLGVHVSVVIREIRSYGVDVTREPPRVVRGFRANNHDRWYGPGSSSTHGGSGHEQITGFGGQEG